MSDNAQGPIWKIGMDGSAPSWLKHGLLDSDLQACPSERLATRCAAHQPCPNGRRVTYGEKLVVTAGSYGSRRKAISGDTRRRRRGWPAAILSWSATSGDTRRNAATTILSPVTFMGFRWSGRRGDGLHAPLRQPVRANSPCPRTGGPATNLSLHESSGRRWRDTRRGYGGRSARQG